MKIIECSTQKEFNQIVDRARGPQSVKQSFDVDGNNSISLNDDGSWDGYCSRKWYEREPEYRNAAFLTGEEFLTGKKGKRGRPRTKPPQVNFLLKYDLDEDPIEEFETMEQVKERIKQLSTRSDLKRDSIVIYHIKKKQAATIETTIKIK